MKLLPSALVLVLAAGLAAPAFASDSLTASSSDNDFNAASILQGLRANGVNAIEVAEDWNNNVRATVKLDDGSVAFQYYDEDTLAPVGKTSGNTRVLSKLDVGAKAPVTSLDSLTYQGDGSSFK